MNYDGGLPAREELHEDTGPGVQTLGLRSIFSPAAES
jgi:hypothetical protein